MKKIILVLIIFIACYFIYNLTIDKKVSYLTLGDILSKGTNEYSFAINFRFASGILRNGE